MHKKSFLWLWLCLLVVCAGLSRPVHADITLSPGDWYAVLHTQLSDKLIWINEDGVQATIQRPQIPNEQQGPKGGRDIRISPDGRFGVITVILNTGRQSINFYDFQTGTLIKSHTAQLNEVITLGSGLSFNEQKSEIAVGYYTPGSSGVANWRIIIFNFQTGNSTGSIDKDETSSLELQSANNAYPYIYYSPGKDATYRYRFMMIPYATGGRAEYPAYAWAPASNQTKELGMVSSEPDFHPATDTMLETRYEIALPQFEGNLGSVQVQNVVAKQLTPDTQPEILINETKGSVITPRWISNGAGFAYRVLSANETYWVLHLDQENQQYRFKGESSPSEVYGTTNGYLMNFDNKTFIASDTIDPAGQPVLYESPDGDSAHVIYITPLGGVVGISSIDEDHSQSPQPQQPQQSIEADPKCAGAPKPLLVPGIPARVTFTDGSPLRVRQQPGGTVITELAEGTQFTVTEGPVCVNGHNWWKISLPLESATLIGWVAEGNMEGYFVEIWYEDGEGSAQSPLAISPVALTTLEPQLVQITPITVTTQQVPPVAMTPVIIAPGFITDGDCSNAVAQYLSVGATVIAQPDGTLAMRDNPTDEIPSNQIASGVSGTITDGPLCHKGFRRWKVAFTSGQTGWVPDSYKGKLYLKKN